MSKKLAEYTVPIENDMRVKHSAKGRFTVKSGNRILQDDLIDSESISGAFTVASCMYNKLTMSGGVSWFDPITGHSIKRPHVMVKFRSEDILIGKQECDCERCHDPSN